MRSMIAGAVAALLLVASSMDGGGQRKDEGKPLFQGDLLTGWKVYLDPGKDVEDADKVFTLKEGVLTCRGSVNGYIRTEKAFADYVLTLEWRWTDEAAATRRGGVFVHVSGPDRLYPKAAAMQLMLDHAGDLWLLNGFKLQGPAGQQDLQHDNRYLRLRDPAEKPPGEWNRLEVTAKGNNLRFVVNGHLVNEGKRAEATGGNIALQAEGAELQFRNVRLGASK